MIGVCQVESEKNKALRDHDVRGNIHTQIAMQNINLAFVLNPPSHTGNVNYGNQ